MAKLAIRGHKERGKEVIALLEMLGGNNKYHINITECNFLYTIGEGDDAIIATYPNSNISQIFTLEQFLEKFPYKVGDKVQHKGATSCGSIYEVEKMRWEENTVKYTVHLFGCNYKSSTLPSEYLQPYKEETMKEIKIDIPKGYEFAGVDDDNQQVVFTKIGYHYPNTYEECFNICFGNKHHIIQVVGLDGLGDNKELFESFIKLKICRDAYWNIAGEQMGLGKPWEPNWHDDEWLDMYYISWDGKHLEKENGYPCCNIILIFPSAEMRDVFYNNFKELIEQCKELL
jgi:hypothetical protein